MRRSVLLAGAATLLAAPLSAQETGLDRLRGMQTTGAEMMAIDQAGARAKQLRAMLEERITLPEGFRIALYGVVPDARHIAVAPQGTVTFVGTRKQNVWSVVDRDKDRVADEVVSFAPAVDFTIPNGVCFSPDGFLYVAAQNRVLVFPAAEFFFEGADVAADVVVPEGELIPAAEESFNHSARVCRIGPDGKLYIALGQPYNVPPPEKMDLCNEWGIGGIIRMERDGTGREVYTYGVRNSVGMAFNPANGELWFTDNQVDGMGDDIPPGELNRQTAAGQHFGFPWYGGGDVRTTEYQDSEPPADLVFPAVEMVAHAADLGMMFYTHDQFPAEYRGGIFSAQHGSWNRTTPIGARVMFTEVLEDGSAGETRVFAEGWLDDETGEYHGRPVDVAPLPDGSILVSDDFAGALYRIWYEG